MERAAASIQLLILGVGWAQNSRCFVDPNLTPPALEIRALWICRKTLQPGDCGKIKTTNKGATGGWRCSHTFFRWPNPVANLYQGELNWSRFTQENSEKEAETHSPLLFLVMVSTRHLLHNEERRPLKFRPADHLNLKASCTSLEMSLNQIQHFYLLTWTWISFSSWGTAHFMPCISVVLVNICPIMRGSLAPLISLKWCVEKDFATFWHWANSKCLLMQHKLI